MKKCFLVFASCLLGGSLLGQTDTIYNSHAMEKIPYYEQLYRFRVWRDMYLNEKQNATFISPYSNIASFILEGLKNDQLKAYAPDDFSFASPIEAVTAIGKGEKSSLPDFSFQKDYPAGEEVSYQGKTYKSSKSMIAVRNPTNTDFWKVDKSVKKLPADLPAFDEKKPYSGRDAVAYNGSKYIALDDMTGVFVPTDKSYWEETGAVQDFLAKEDVKTIQLVEDVIFDKRRARLYYDVIGFIILDPTTGNPNAIVSYKEFFKLVEKLSRDKEMRIRNSVKWKNRYNPSQDLTFTDAIKLRLFHGVINKVENPDDKTITDVIFGGGKSGRGYGEAVFARWEEEMKLMEKEHNLWEY